MMTVSMMGVNRSRQIYQEQVGKVMSGGNMGYDANGGVSKQLVQDSSFWLPPASRAHQAAVTERRARSALRALLQQPPPLSLGPDDSGLEMGDSPNGVIHPSWPPSYLDEIGDFQTPKGHSPPSSIPSPRQFTSLPQSEPQGGHLGFNLQQPASSHYHVDFSHGRLVQQQPLLVGSLSLSQEISELERLREKKKTTGQDFPVGSTRMGSSLPKEFEKLQMTTFAQEQMNRHERRPSDKQVSLPEGPGRTELKFGGSPNGMHNGPHNHPMSQSQQQEQDFARRVLSQAHHQHDQNTGTFTRDLPCSTVMMDTKDLVDDADAMVIKRFQENVSKLDMGTRLGLRQSLLRLATHARKRQDAMGMSNPCSTDSNYGSAMGMDPREGAAALQQSRVQVETQTNPVDRKVMNMLFLPLRLPGLQTPQPEHRPSSWTKARVAPAVSSQASWMWSTSVGPKSNNWTNPADQVNSSHTIQTVECLSRGGSGRTLDAAASTTVIPFMQWNDSPQLTDYASPPAPSSSPVDPSMVEHRPVDIYKSALGAVAQAARQLGGNLSPTPQPVNIRGPRRSDSQSSITSDHSYSNCGGQGLHFGAMGLHEPSSYGPQDAGSFAGDGQHVELAANNYDRGETNQNFASCMMNMNADILGAAMSIQSRSAVDPIGGFHPPSLSSTSQNSSTNNITVGFSRTLDEAGSHFQSELRGRTLGDTSMSTGMSFLDQRNSSVPRSIVETLPYTRLPEFYSS